MALFANNTVNTDFAKCNKLIYGPPKSGKTTLAAVMVDAQGRVPLFAGTEDGYGSLQVALARVRSWDGFLKFLDYCESKKDQLVNEHSCIVLDLVSDLDSWCSTAVAAKKNVEYVGDLDQGKGWKLLRDEFQKQITRVMTLMPVTFIAHTQDKRLTLNGEQIVAQAPSLSKAAFEYVNGKVDAIMFVLAANSKKEFPQITMAPQTGYIAGCRQKAMCRTFDFNPATPALTWQAMTQLYAQAQAPASAS